MLSSVLLFFSITISVSFTLILLLNQTSDFIAYKSKLDFEKNFKHVKKDFLQELENKLHDKNPQLAKLMGKGLLLKFYIPLILLFSLATLIIGPYLAGYRYGIILGLVIFLAYALRLSYHLVSQFRDKILEQIERTLITIRNNLSSGQTLDYAVNYTATTCKFKPVISDLNYFIANNNINILEAFPQWFRLLEKEYRIPDLGKFSQLLALELKHNNNQEEALLNSIEVLIEKNTQNKKQKNTINVSFITLDFMIMIFLGLIFFVIPQLNFNTDTTWWQSERRVLIIFITGLIIWFAYSSTILISFWRIK